MDWTEFDADAAALAGTEKTGSLMLYAVSLMQRFLRQAEFILREIIALRLDESPALFLIVRKFVHGVAERFIAAHALDVGLRGFDRHLFRAPLGLSALEGSCCSRRGREPWSAPNKFYAGQESEQN
jgi:hypothetical protein